MPETNELLAVVPHVDDTNFKQFMLSLESLNQEAEALEINTYDDTQKGIEIRKAAKLAENDIEDTRVRMVKPLNDHVSAINAKAKEIKAPVLKVLSTVDAKLKAYQAEQDRIAAQKRAEEQAKLDAERKIREEEERKKREQEEKERAEAQAKIDAAKKEADEKLRIANEATDAAEKKRLEDEANIAAERAKLEQDKKDFEAKKQADADAIAKKAEQDRWEQEQLQKSQIKPEESIKGMKTRMKFEVINENEVPRELLSIDEKKIRDAIKNGALTIPGLRIFEEKGF